jgi:hypothetical protein
MNHEYGRIVFHNKYESHKGQINSIHERGDMLVSCSVDAKLYLWDLNSLSKDPKVSIKGHK